MADEDPGTPVSTRTAVAAGALFVDDDARLMLVRPVYKPYWDIPGGYVEPGESPREACTREIAEELGLHVEVGGLLVVDWAPHPTDGDKILFVFDGGTLSDEQHAAIALQASELAEYRYVAARDLDDLTIPRLARRLRAALEALHHGKSTYLENGSAATRGPAASA